MTRFGRPPVKSTCWYSRRRFLILVAGDIRRARVELGHEKEVAMIIGAEVALLFMGLYALIKGKFPTNKKAKYVVEDWPVRVIGAILVLPIPLSFLVGTVVAALFVAQGKQVTRESFFWVGTAIEGSILVGCMVVAGILSRVYRNAVVPASTEQPI
jgi:hypothetical protein